MKMNGFAEVSILEMEVVNGGQTGKIVEEVVKSGLATAAFDFFKAVVETVYKAVTTPAPQPAPAPAPTRVDTAYKAPGNLG